MEKNSFGKCPELGTHTSSTAGKERGVHAASAFLVANRSGIQPASVSVRRSGLKAALLSAKVIAGSFVLSGLLSSTAGTINGSVRAEGKQGADTAAQGGKYDSRQFKFVERMNYAELRDFVVYIDGLVVTNIPSPAPTAQVVTKRIAQRGATFEPHVLPVMVGTTVEWPNNDEILHNVFSFSEPKSFDLGLYKNPEIKKVTFDKPGRVDVFCSIHSRMSCVVLVLQNPYFTSTTDKGNYTIRNVPAGKYTLKAWHERLPSQLQEIVVPENGEVRADFVMGIKGLPKP